jgi:hypothetical protein
MLSTVCFGCLTSDTDLLLAIVVEDLVGAGHVHVLVVARSSNLHINIGKLSCLHAGVTCYTFFNLKPYCTWKVP